MIVKNTSIIMTIDILGLLLFGNALSMHTIESIERSIEINAQRPIQLLFITAVVLDIFVRLNEMTTKDIMSIVSGMK